MLEKNMCFFDRAIRTLVSIGIILWIVSASPIFGSGIITLLIGVFGMMNIFAALTGVCMGYSMFRLSTLRKG